LELVRSLVPQDNGLAVLATTRRDASVQASVVNAGVLPHPVDGSDVVGLVAQGGAAKLRNLRERPRATVVFRAGWNWASVEGPVDLVGPDDPMLLREVFTAAGGTHEDFEAYDRAMAEERRVAVLVRPDRVTSNRGA
jgi:PPOX class probable F420-dependent enzyme